jgi:hypothetical protein
MSILVRAQDREHFSIVQESLARDGLHVAMVAHDRGRLQDYASTLARALTAHAGLRIEAYDPGYLESIIVDLMLHGFDSALSDISGTGRSGTGGAGRHAAGRPGCVLFVPDADALPRAEFRQLLRIAAGTHRHGLRLVALFNASSPASEERIAELGTQVARWDIDDEVISQAVSAAMPWRRRRTADALAHDHPTPASQTKHRLSASQATSSLPRTAHKLAGQRGAWLAAAGLAAVLLTLPAMLPWHDNPSMQAHHDGRDNHHSDTRTVTRSGIVELAGEPRQDFVRAAAPDLHTGERLDNGFDTDPDVYAGRSLDGRMDANEATRASTGDSAMEGRSR